MQNGKDFIKEACFISTKVYSLLCKNTEIIKCKSIPKKLKLQHKMYKDRLPNYEKPFMAKWKLGQSKNNNTLCTFRVDV